MSDLGHEEFPRLARRILPVSHANQTQVAVGQLMIATQMFRAGDVAMARLRLSIDTVSSILLQPDFVALILPVQGEHWVNGVRLIPPLMYLSADGSGYFARGGARDVVSLGLKRSRLIETLTALEGCTTDEVELGNLVIDIPLQSFFALRQTFMALIGRCANETNVDALPQTSQLEECLFGAVIDAYLAGSKSDPRMMRGATGTSREQVVRRAEEYFEAMQARRFSLADLCAATGVGRHVLYSAFRHLFDETPLAYFHRRRLNRARLELLKASPEQDYVKQIALDLGLTELGRFSVEYRKLFGVSPMTTLHQSQRKPANEISPTATLLRASNISKFH